MFGKKDDFPSQVYLVKAEDLSKPLVIPSKVRLTGSYDPTVPEDRIKYILLSMEKRVNSLLGYNITT